MKPLFVSIFLLLSWGLNLKGQTLKSVSSFAEAQKISQKLTKPLMLALSVPAQYKVKAASVLSAETIKTINRDFIVYEIYLGDAELQNFLSKLGRKYSAPSFYFFNSSGDMVYTEEGGKMRIRDGGKKMISEALTALEKPSIKELEQNLENVKDTSKLKQLIVQRRKLGRTDNTEWLDLYVNLLNEKDFNNYQTVLFILKSGPLAFDSSYKKAYSNKKIIDSIYKTEPLEIRQDVSNIIIRNTLDNAIKNKNYTMAQKGAQYARSSWGKEWSQGNRAFDAEMLKYFNGIKDTLNYLPKAVKYYDHYYMNLSLDSIRKLEEKTELKVLEKRFTEEKNNVLIVTRQEADSLIKNKIPTGGKNIVSPKENSNFTAINLNNVAYRFFDLGTLNPFYLNKALTWSRRAIELNPTPEYYDTLAHLLYRSNNFEAALEAEQKAYNLALEKGQPAALYKTELKKIREKIL